jgi:hypothetical protein
MIPKKDYCAGTEVSYQGVHNQTDKAWERHLSFIFKDTSIFEGHNSGIAQFSFYM